MYHYEPRLVALSLLIAVLASYTGLDLVGRVRQAGGTQRAAWLVVAATVLGGGIWSMHFIGMLALHVDFPVSYATGPTLASLVLPISIVGAALSIALHDSGNRTAKLYLGGAAMGFGIVTMHYLGMAAMRMPATITYVPGLVVVSVLLAVVASIGALWLVAHPVGRYGRAASALLMGAAIGGMHYTGMAAADFVLLDGSPAWIGGGVDSSRLAWWVGTLSMVLLIGALAAAAWDRAAMEHRSRTIEETLRREMNEAQQARELSEQHFRLAIEAANIGVWDWDLETDQVRSSDRMQELLGLEPAATISAGTLRGVVHPADLKAVRSRLLGLARAGTPVRQLLEFRVIRADGDIRWISARAQALVRAEVDRVHPVRVLGTVQDITMEKVRESRLHRSLDQKEILLREVHHRVSNNLQMIWGMIQLERARLGDYPLAADRLDAIARRITALGRIQNALYRREDFSQIELGMLVEIQGRDMLPSEGAGAADVKISVDRVTADLDTAVPFALILDELLTNAAKHGGPAGRPRAISITLRRTEEEQVVLTVENAVHQRQATPPGTGLIFLEALASQLGGSFTFGGNGTGRAQLVFPVPEGAGASHLYH